MVVKTFTSPEPVPASAVGPSKEQYVESKTSKLKIISNDYLNPEKCRQNYYRLIGLDFEWHKEWKNKENSEELLWKLQSVAVVLALELEPI